MLITITLIGGSLFVGYYYRETIAWNVVKLYTYINKSINKEELKVNENENIIINDILYIEHNETDLTEELLFKIKNRKLNIIDNNFIEINNVKININEINVINNKGDISNLKNYLYSD